MTKSQSQAGTIRERWRAHWRELRRNDIGIQLIATLLVLALLPVLLVSAVGNRSLDRAVLGLERQLDIQDSPARSSRGELVAARR